jgi:hypothetical protein
MFLKTSRYVKTETLETVDSRGRQIQAIKLRRLPQVGGEVFSVINGSELDVMSYQQYGDGTKFWHIADANTELEADVLVQKSGRVINKPKA